MFDHTKARSGYARFGQKCSMSLPCESTQYMQRSRASHLLQDAENCPYLLSLACDFPRAFDICFCRRKTPSIQV
jgi:hypothetical protein